MPLKINDISTMPQVDEAITGWEYDILVNKRKQTMVNGDVVYKNIFIKMLGCIQPLKMSEIEVKPEHERDWEWFYLHIKTTYPILTVNQQVFIKGNPYKVMRVKDYGLNAYREYEIIRDYNTSIRGATS